MAYLVDVKVNGEDIYADMEILVIYRHEDAWVMEELLVDGGQVETTNQIKVGQPYWFGRRFTSSMETLPIRQQGKLDLKGRVSDVSVYLESSQGGTVSIVSEGMITKTLAIPYDSTALFSGRREVKIGSGYANEIAVRVEADGYDPFSVLALDVTYQQTER